MKRFLITLFLFLLPLAVAYTWLEVRLGQIPNSYNQKKCGIDSQLATIEVINVGSSNALSDINPQYFSHKGYNLANVTQTIYYDDQLITRYIGKLPKLKLAIIPIDYAFHRQIELMDEQWRSYFYHYYWDIPVPDCSVFEVKQYSLLAMYSPHSVLNYIKKRFRVSVAPTYLSNGFYRKDSVNHIKNMTDSAGIGRAEYLSRFYSEENVNKSKVCIENSIKLLKAKNVEVVLVSLPFYQTLTGHLDPHILAKNNEIINELRNKYNCRYFNYTTDTRFTIDDFNNCDHMDYLGAEKLSKIIDSEIIRPILK